MLRFIKDDLSVHMKARIQIHRGNIAININYAPSLAAIVFALSVLACGGSSSDDTTLSQ